MKRSLVAPIDPFSISPVFALLPSGIGGLSRLESLSSSLFARYERVQREAEQGRDPSLLRQLHTEEVMLGEVLKWLEVTPGGSDGEG
jgi:hypothetical protein